LPDFTFLHAADIHLDSPLKGLSRYEGVPADEVRAAPRAAFDRLIDTALERRVDFVLIAGDLYDGDWKDMGTGLYFAKAMGRLGAAGIPVYLLAGNHDAASEITRKSPPIGNVHVFSTRKAQTHILERHGVAIHGHSFAQRAVPENLAAAYPAPIPGMFNIGMLHTSLGGYAEHEPYAPCTVQELAARGYDYWALGHVHDHAVLHDDPPIVFSGNLQGRNSRETGPKGAVLVKVAEGGAPRLEFLPMDVVRWLRVPVPADDVADMAGLQANLRAALRHARDSLADGRPLIVRLSIAGETPLHGALQDVGAGLRADVQAIAAEIGDLWIEKLLVGTSPPPTTASAPQADEIVTLLTAPSDELRLELQKDLAPFLNELPPGQREGLVESAAGGAWDRVMAVAGAALRARLGGAG
jgi:DNA repair exonuclease SbcCD nuclease subunit